MGSHVPFECLKHKLWSKNLRIVLVYLRESGMPHIVKKFFALDFTSIGGLYKKLWASKVARVFENFGAFNWESRDKMTFECKPVAKHRKYYKGEGGGFLQVWAMVTFVNLCMSMARSCTKKSLTTH